MTKFLRDTGQVKANFHCHINSFKLLRCHNAKKYFPAFLQLEIRGDNDGNFGVFLLYVMYVYTYVHRYKWHMPIAPLH